MSEYIVSPKIAFLSLFLVLIPLGIVIWWQWQKMDEDFNQPGYEFTFKKSTKISQEEKIEIDVWIRDNDLNKYGDPKDTVYTGGTPLFNEKTGEWIDRYEYILSRHPDRPWQK